MSDTQFPKRFGKYILLDRINSGGMAEVYRAKVLGVEQFERLVAIKCMLPALLEDGQFTTMFIDEAKMASQLTHPNVVQIYELGRVDDRLYIAMELVSGRDLRHVIRTALKQKTPLSLGFAAYVVAKAAEGLDFAHRKAGLDGKPLNLVHRDVSPQNILVSYDGDVKVVDFGIAKAEARATETQAGVLKGKFAYMAPEQVTGGQVDRRADIFALGAVLHEILTGKKLFAGESDLSILDKVRKAEVPSIQSVIPGAPDELQPVIEKALARDKNERYAWASELAEGLEPLLIESRSIYGAKKAAQLMQQLYADEIATLAERQRQWARVSEADLNENTARQKAALTATQVFESAFAPEAKGGTAVVNTSSQTNPDPAPSPKTMVLTPSQVTLEPVSGKTEMLSLTDGVPPPAPVPMAPSMSSASDWDEPSVSKSEKKAFGADWAKAPTAMMESPSKASSAPKSQSHVGSAPKKMPTSPGSKASGVHRTSGGSKVVSGTGTSRGRRKKATMSPLIITGIALSAIITVGALYVVFATTGGAPQPVVATPVPVQDVTPKLTPPAPTPQAPPSTPAPTQAPTTPAPEKPSEAALIKPPPSVAPTEVAAPERKETKPPRPAKEADTFGFISVIAPGVTAKVFVDGKEVGYSPLPSLRVKTGKRKLRIVTEDGREKSEEATVSTKDDKKSPKKIIVRF